MPPGWRRLSPAEKERVRRLYLQAMRGGPDGSAAVQRLYRALRGKSRAEVLEILTGAGNRYADTRVRELQGAARQAAQQARLGTAETLILRARAAGRLPSSESLAEQAARWLRTRSEGARQSYRVSPIDAPRSSVLFPEGDVWLSKNLHRSNTRGVIDGLRKALEDAARHGETATSLAQRLRDEIGHRVTISDTGPPSFKIPEQLREIEREAYAAIKASGDPRAAQAFARTREEFRRYAETLGTGQKGLAAPAMDALRKIESAIRRNDAQAVDRAVKWWTWNREQEHQRLIARTELGRAYSHAYVEGSRAAPWVVGWEWNVDDDPCEACQEQADRGVIDRGSIVFPPLHPNCECWLTEVLDSRMEPSEEQWAEIMAA